MYVMSGVLDGWASIVELLHKLLFKLIFIFHAIFVIIQVLMIVRIEVILVEIVLIPLKIVFMLPLWAWSSVLAHWRLVVVVSSVHFL
jgi:hypothetical protein